MNVDVIFEFDVCDKLQTHSHDGWENKKEIF